MPVVTAMEKFLDILALPIRFVLLVGVLIVRGVLLLFGKDWWPK